MVRDPEPIQAAGRSYPEPCGVGQGFADQEKSVLTGVTEARAKATEVQVNLPPDILTNPEAMKKFAEAQGSTHRALWAFARGFGEVSRHQIRTELPRPANQIEGTENRIAIARRDYIERGKKYNTELNTFPGRIWKSVLDSSAKDMATFDVSPEETKTPKVDFAPRSLER